MVARGVGGGITPPPEVSLRFGPSAKGPRPTEMVRVEVQRRSGDDSVRWDHELDLHALTERLHEMVRDEHPDLGRVLDQGHAAQERLRVSLQEEVRFHLLEAGAPPTLPDTVSTAPVSSVEVEVDTGLSRQAVAGLVGLPLETVERTLRYPNGTSASPQDVDHTPKVLVLIGERAPDGVAGAVAPLPDPSMLPGARAVPGFRWECPATPSSAVARISEQPWDVVVVVGHGDAEAGAIVLTPDAAGTTLTGAALAAAVTRSGPTLVILLACEAARSSALVGDSGSSDAGMAQALLDAGTPEVVAASTAVSITDADRATKALVASMATERPDDRSITKLAESVIAAFAPANETDRSWLLRHLRRDPPLPNRSLPPRTVTHPWAAFSPFGRSPYQDPDLWLPLLLDIGAAASLVLRPDVPAAPGWLTELVHALPEAISEPGTVDHDGLHLQVHEPQWPVDVPGVEFARAMAVARLLASAAGAPLPADTGKRIAGVLGLGDQPWWYHGTDAPWWTHRTASGVRTCAPPSVDIEARFTIHPVSWQNTGDKPPTWGEAVRGWKLPELTSPSAVSARQPAWAEFSSRAMPTVTLTSTDEPGDRSLPEVRLWSRGSS